MADSQLLKLVSGVDSSGRLSKTAGIVLLMKSPRRSNVAARRTSACCRSYDSLEKAVVASILLSEISSSESARRCQTPSGTLWCTPCSWQGLGRDWRMPCPWPLGDKIRHVGDLVSLRNQLSLPPRNGLETRVGGSPLLRLISFNLVGRCLAIKARQSFGTPQGCGGFRFSYPTKRFDGRHPFSPYPFHLLVILSTSRPVAIGLSTQYTGFRSLQSPPVSLFPSFRREEDLACCSIARSLSFTFHVVAMASGELNTHESADGSLSTSLRISMQNLSRNGMIGRC